MKFKYPKEYDSVFDELKDDENAKLWSQANRPSWWRNYNDWRSFWKK